MDLRKLSITGFRWIHMFWDVLNTIWQFSENVCLSVSLSVCMFPKFCGNCISRMKCAEIDEISYSVASWYNLKLIRFWCISLKKFRYCSKFFISLTHWYRTILRVVVPNTSYLKPIILKFKTLIYNNNGKIIYSFCTHGGFTPPVG